MPGAGRAHGPPAEKKQAAVTTGPAGHPAFPARWAYVLYVISPVNGLSCHRHPREAKLLSANLAPASRRQDHTTSTSAKSLAPSPRRRTAAALAQGRSTSLVVTTSSRPPHPAPRVVTTARTPLVSRRDSADKTTDLGVESS